MNSDQGTTNSTFEIRDHKPEVFQAGANDLIDFLAGQQSPLKVPMVCHMAHLAILSMDKTVITRANDLILSTADSTQFRELLEDMRIWLIDGNFEKPDSPIEVDPISLRQQLNDNLRLVTNAVLETDYRLGIEIKSDNFKDRRAFKEAAEALTDLKMLSMDLAVEAQPIEFSEPAMIPTRPGAQIQRGVLGR